MHRLPTRFLHTQRLVRMALVALVLIIATGPQVVIARRLDPHNRLRIVVLPFVNATGDRQFDALSQGFADLLVSSLSAYDDLALLERRALYQVLDELGLARSAIHEHGRLAKVGKLLQARLFIKGSFTRVNAVLTVQAHVVDVETAQLVYATQEAGRLGDIATLGEAVALAITRQLVSEQLQLASFPTDRKPKLNLHFMRGLGYYYNHLFTHAVAEFMQVVDLDPAHAEGRFWIAKSYVADQVFDHAKIELEAFLAQFPHHLRAADVRVLLQTLQK